MKCLKVVECNASRWAGRMSLILTRVAQGLSEVFDVVFYVLFDAVLFAVHFPSTVVQKRLGIIAHWNPLENLCERACGCDGQNDVCYVYRPAKVSEYVRD